MNLTDILLFGDVINGGNSNEFVCGGVYDGGYRISEEVLDLTKFTAFTMVVGGEAQTMTKEEFTGYGGVVTADKIGSPDGSWIAMTQKEANDNMPVGTYVWCDEYGYVSRLVF